MLEGGNNLLLEVRPHPLAMRKRLTLPVDQSRIKDGPLNASSLVIPLARRVANFGDTSKADANAAGHRSLERNPARNLGCGCDVSDSFHHRFGTTAHDLAGVGFGEYLRQHVRDETMVAE